MLTRNKLSDATFKTPNFFKVNMIYKKINFNCLLATVLFYFYFFNIGNTSTTWNYREVLPLLL